MAPEPPLASVRSRENSVQDDDTTNAETDQKNLDCEEILRRNAIHCRLGWLWNQGDSSKEVCVTDEGGCKTGVTFHPHWSNGTAGIRSYEPLLGDFNYWEIHVGNRVFGTSLMFGVSTKKARLHANEFTNMLGKFLLNFYLDDNENDERYRLVLNIHIINLYFALCYVTAFKKLDCTDYIYMFYNVV